ncbi:MAG: diguanylate cyclase [Gammaproteobacteria bacterium]
MKDVLLELEHLFDILPDAVVVVDHTGTIVYANQWLDPLLGYSPEEVEGESLSIFIPEQYRALHQKQVAEFHRHGKPTSMGSRPVLHALHRSGKEVPISISITNLDLEGERYSVAVMRDASHFSAHIDKVTALAEKDALTGVCNRLCLSQRIQEALANRQPFALLFIDLSKFKPFNDRYGHKMGDEVLKLVAQRLTSTVRRGDVAGRLGGDEFVVLLGNFTDRKQLAERAKEINNAIQAPFSIESVRGSIEAHIGGAIYPDDGLNEESLLAVADQNMYEAKKKEKSFFYKSVTELG